MWSVVEFLIDNHFPLDFSFYWYLILLLRIQKLFLFSVSFYVIWPHTILESWLFTLYFWSSEISRRNTLVCISLYNIIVTYSMSICSPALSFLFSLFFYLLVVFKNDFKLISFLSYSRMLWIRHNSLSLFTFMHWRRKWQPTPVLLPGESQGWGSLVGCRLWGLTELDATEVT